MATAPSAERPPSDRPGPRLYYERTGAGAPLQLLHGAFGTIESCFARLRPRLERRFQVVAVELEGHGRSQRLDRPLTSARMARDTAALVERLGVAPSTSSATAWAGPSGWSWR